MPRTDERGSTTITVPWEIHERLTELKPYDSLSYAEFLQELMDEWESEEGVA